MANYTQNEKATDLDVLTTLASDDVVVVGDTSDSGKAKAITKANLLIDLNGAEVAASATDTTPGVLNDKIEIVSADSSVTVTKTIQNPGANEKISYDLSASGSGSGGGGGSGEGILIDSDTTPFSHTGDTNETTAYTISIPASTLGTQNAVRFSLFGLKTNGGGTVTYRAKYGTSTFTTIVDADNNSNVEIVLDGMLIADAGTTDQVGYSKLAGFVSGVTQTFVDNGTAITEDSTVDKNLVITVQLSNSAGVASFKGIVVEKLVLESPTSLYVTTPVMVGIVGVSNLAMSSNTTMYLGMVDIPTKITVSNVNLGCQSVNANGTISFAVYSESGATRLIQGTTATISSTGTVTTAITPVTLDAGKYYVGYHSNGSANLNINSIRFDPDIEFLSDIGSGPILVGNITITASTTPSTITPASITTGLDMPLMRFD